MKLPRDKYKLGQTLNINRELRGSLRIRGKIYFLTEGFIKVDGKKIYTHFCLLPENSYSIIGVIDTDESPEGYDLYLSRGLDASCGKLLKTLCGKWGGGVGTSEHGLQGVNYIHLDGDPTLTVWFKGNIPSLPAYQKGLFAEKLAEFKIVDKALKDAGIKVNGYYYSRAVKDLKGHPYNLTKLRKHLVVKGWSEKTAANSDRYRMTKEFSGRQVSLFFSRFRSQIDFMGYKISADKSIGPRGRSQGKKGMTRKSQPKSNRKHGPDPSQLGSAISLRFKSDRSDKFWSCQIQGTKLVITYGRHGTPGSRLEKNFQNHEMANKAFMKLVGQKLKKGYQKA